MATSMILRACRSAARAGRSIAADPLPRPSVPSRSQGTIATPARGKRVEFVAEAKDLDSDEAIWPLYERWCVAFGQERGRDEMARRFKTFKETVLLVYETNRADLPYKLGINDMADGKLRELRGMKVPLSLPGDEKRRMRPSSGSLVYRRPISNDEPVQEEERD